MLSKGLMCKYDFATLGTDYKVEIVILRCRNCLRLIFKRVSGFKIWDASDATIGPAAHIVCINVAILQVL